MTSTALKEAAQVGFPPDMIVGPHPTCAVGRQAMDCHHRLDRHGSGAGAAPRGGVGSQVCTGEGHHTTDLRVGLGMHAPGG